jgi:hypothetical protein
MFIAVVLFCVAVQTDVHPFCFLASFCIFVATISCLLGKNNARCTAQLFRYSVLLSALTAS